jgi:Sulfotransferase family
VLPSLTELTEVLGGLFGRVSDREQIGRREARATASSMERFVQFRELRPELAGRFIDVNYSELVSTPLTVIHRIYQRLEIPLTEAAAGRMRHLAANRSRYRRRHAGPKLADAALDAGAETRRFERYCSRFGIPCSQTGPN